MKCYTGRILEAIEGSTKEYDEGLKAFNDKYEKKIMEKFKEKLLNSGYVEFSLEAKGLLSTSSEDMFFVKETDLIQIKYDDNDIHLYRISKDHKSCIAVSVKLGHRPDAIKMLLIDTF